MLNFTKLKGFLTFSRTERLGIWLLLLLILLSVLAPFFYQKMNPIQFKEAFLSDALRKELDQSYNEQPKKNINENNGATKKTKDQFINILESFDPNQTKESTWLGMGLKPFQIKIIMNYLNKKGSFKIKTDLAKIHTIDPAWFEQVRPFISLPDSLPQRISSYEKKEFVKKKLELIDINEADSQAFEKLPGIGAYLAGKIITYRKHLGGFHSKLQLLEIWGMKAELYNMFEEKIKLEIPLEKIAINTCEEILITDHPYIRKKLGKMIIQYRKQHGKIKNIEELKILPLMHDSTLLKIAPYFKF